MLNQEELLDYIRKAKNGDEKAKDIIFTSNTPLIKSIIRRFVNNGVEYEDLYQIACVGFLKAINNFDESFGVKFSTYSVPMVIGEVKRYMRDNGAIKVSRALKILANKINRFIDAYQLEHNNSPSIELLAEKFEVSSEEVVFALDSSKLPISIFDKFEDDEDGQELIEKLPYADDEDKIQLVLKDVTITNSDMPCVYVKNADKVFITTMSTNSLSVTGTFTSDGETSTDAVIFSRDDVVFNGNGSLTIQSSDNGISSKDDIKITGGTITINCVNDALETHEMIAVAGGNLTIKTSKDGFHAEYDDNDTVGSVYIQGGVIQIDAGDDGIHAITNLVIDGGTIDIKAKEGLEGTYIQINDGSVNISASDDGVNAAQKSKAFTATFEMNGGELTVNMGAGDTDAIDSNGNLYVNGGTVTITAQSPFDYDGEGKYTGGTMIINGEETTTITNQMMGGPGGQGGRGRSR